MKPSTAACIAGVALACALAPLLAEEPRSPPSHASTTVRVAAAQPRSRLIDWRLQGIDEVLARVEKSLTELEGLVEEAARRRCDVIALPEDTLGLGNWLAGNQPRARELLRPAVEKMLARFARAAARHKVYIVCCNNSVDSGGLVRNTAFLLGRDGKELGRYHKVCPTIHERACTPGNRLPVFDTPDLGGVGLLICYDMVFPEPARCLALGGADIIFHPTLGGAAIGDDDLSRAAFRTRAVENFVYLVVAQRGSGSMIVSPQGKVLAEAQGPDSLAVADIDPFGGREGGDAMNHQRDMRARLFRERNPAAFGILTDPDPPVLAKVPATITEEEAVRIANRVLTIGQEEFRAAEALARAKKTREAIDAFTRLRKEYPASWIDRVAADRLARLQPAEPAPDAPAPDAPAPDTPAPDRPARDTPAPDRPAPDAPAPPAPMKAATEVAVAPLCKTFSTVEASVVSAITRARDEDDLAFSSTCSVEQGESHRWGELSTDGEKMREVKDRDARALANGKVVALTQSADRSTGSADGPPTP